MERSREGERKGARPVLLETWKIKLRYVTGV